MAEEERSRARGGEDVRSILASLLGGQPAEQVAQTEPVITNVDYSRFAEYVLRDKEEIELEQATDKIVEEILRRAATSSRKYVDVFVKDGLSRILHPVYGGSIVDARLGQLAMLLRDTIRALWNHVLDLIHNNAPAEDVYRAARAAEEFTKLAPLIVEEMYSKLLTLLYANAPAKARPPLVNVILGYDILQ